jgi:hypothetical protein
MAWANDPGDLSMFKRSMAAALCITCCSAADVRRSWRGDAQRIAPHGGQDGAGAAKSYVEIENYDELYKAVRAMVVNHAEKGYFRASNYTGELDADVERVCQSVYYEDPLGAFALNYITGATSRIVSYYEVEITATYKRTLSQISGIITASSLRYFESELLNRLTSYYDYFAIRTSLEAVTTDSIIAFMTDSYYAHPMDCGGAGSHGEHVPRRGGGPHRGGHLRI